MFFDTHIHSKWSGDSEAEPESMIASAKEKGLPGITFTDHLDWDFPCMPHYFDLDIENYLPQMKKTASEYSKDGFTIRVGLELGLQPHLKEAHEKLLSSHDFDFVIGSIHQINGIDPYFKSFFENRSFKEAYDEYFEAALSNLSVFLNFDSFGHLDYISRYGQQYAQITGGSADDGILHFSDHADSIEAILSILIHNDKALEINTAPFRHSFPEPNPSREIIKRYYDMGGRLITIGADAHTPEDVAVGFDRLQSILKDIGFKSYYVYENRKPAELPI